MATIETNYAGLKRLAKQFIDALPGAAEDEAEAGWHCFALAYLGARFNGSVEESQAAALYSAMARLYSRWQGCSADERPRLLQQWSNGPAAAGNIQEGAQHGG